VANPYSTRLLAWSSSESPAPYIVPTGYLVVVRDLDVWSGGGAIINWQLAINAVAKFAAGSFTIEALAQTAQWRGRQIVYAGEALVFSSDGSTDGLVSGYLLTDDVAP
jgi:hypothetical protein